MRHYLPAAAVAALVVGASPALGTLTVLKSNGEEASPSEATVAFDAKTGGWNITLHKLYAPGDWTSYDVHGDAGEIIDNIVIDVPCWDHDGECIPAGSPVVVRVVSDGEAGVRTVRNIVQTGTAERSNSCGGHVRRGRGIRRGRGDRRDPRRPRCHRPRNVHDARQPGPRRHACRGRSRHPGRREALSSASVADHRARLRTRRDGRPAGHDPRQARRRAGRRLRGRVGGHQRGVNGGAGSMFAAFGGASFTGTLEIERMHSPWNGWPARISIWGRFEGLISIGRSFDHPDQWMEFARDGLGGQIVINADGHPNGERGRARSTSDSTATPSTSPSPRRSTRPIRPRSVAAASAWCLALHAEACGPRRPAARFRPAHRVSRSLCGCVTTVPWTSRERTRSRSSVARTGSSDPYTLLPPGTLAIGVDPGDANTLLIAPVGGGEGLEAGYDYRIAATSDLVCAVTAPPVAWTASYDVSVVGGCRVPRRHRRGRDRRHPGSARAPLRVGSVHRLPRGPGRERHGGLRRPPGADRRMGAVRVERMPFTSRDAAPLARLAGASTRSGCRRHPLSPIVIVVLVLILHVIVVVLRPCRACP